MPNMENSPTFKTMGLEEKINYFKPKRDEINRLGDQMRSKQALYNAELELAFGHKMGEPVSILDFYSAMLEAKK